MIRLPEIEVGGEPKPPMSPHDFVQSQGVGVPNGRMADDGTRSLLRSEYDFAPWAGSQSALGLMPSGEEGGGFEPSLLQNLREGHYGDAAGQAVSMVPEVGPAIAKGALGVGALYKALKATRADMDPSLSRIFMVADPNDAASKRAMDMFHDSRSPDEIWRETQRDVSPTGQQTIEEISDHDFAFTPRGENAFTRKGDVAPIADMFTHSLLKDRLPEVFNPNAYIMKRSTGTGGFDPSNGDIVISSPSPYSGQWWEAGDAIANHELTHSALKATGSYDVGVLGSKAQWERPELQLLAALAPYLKRYREGDPTALIPFGKQDELAARKLMPGSTFAEFVKDPGLNEHEIDAVTKMFAVDNHMPIDPNNQFRSMYYPNYQEYLARLAMMRRGLTPEERSQRTLLDTLRNTPAMPNSPHPTRDRLYEFPKTLLPPRQQQFFDK